MYIDMNGSLMIVMIHNNNDMGIFKIFFFFFTERTDSEATKYCYWIISDTDT